MTRIVLKNNSNRIVIRSSGIRGPQGPTGPQGPPGSAATDKNFTQAFTNQSSVTVTHNLSKKPAVTVIDSAGDECEGDIAHISDNSLVVSFSASFSGTVLCN